MRSGKKVVVPRSLNQRRYLEAVDPRSAHEVLAERTAAKLKAQEQAAALLSFGADEGLAVGVVEAPDAPDGLVQLRALANDADLTARSASCVLTQRLVRKLCTNCREEVEPNPALLQKLGLSVEEPGALFRPVGCEACLNSGYLGQTAVFGMLILTDPVKEALAAGRSKMADLLGGAEDLRSDLVAADDHRIGVDDRREEIRFVGVALEELDVVVRRFEHFLELFDGRGAEGVAGGQHHAAPVLFVAPGQLADRRALPARDDQPIQLVELLRQPDLHRLHAQPAQDLDMFDKRPLQGQDADSHGYLLSAISCQPSALSCRRSVALRSELCQQASKHSLHLDNLRAGRLIGCLIQVFQVVGQE